jgi:ferredoxin
MKATIDRTGCISCGLCETTCPEVFGMAADGYAEVLVESIPASAEASAKEAAECCPVAVITVE